MTKISLEKFQELKNQVEFKDWFEKDRVFLSMQKMHEIIKRLGEDSELNLYAEHDIIYFGCSNKDYFSTMTEEDAIYLIKCGVHADLDSDCLAKHV